MSDVILAGGQRREKMLVMLFTRSVGVVNLETLEDVESIKKIFLQDRDTMLHINGVDNLGQVVHMAFESLAVTERPWEIMGICIRPAPKEPKVAPGRIMPVPAPPTH